MKGIFKIGRTHAFPSMGKDNKLKYYTCRGTLRSTSMVSTLQLHTQVAFMQASWPHRSTCFNNAPLPLTSTPLPPPLLLCCMYVHIANPCWYTKDNDNFSSWGVGGIIAPKNSAFLFVKSCLGAWYDFYLLNEQLSSFTYKFKEWAFLHD